MPSTTIRYSTLPENSQSISLASAHPPHHDPAGGSLDTLRHSPDPALPVVHFYEADPETPGAYRHDPDTYDPSIPDSDPRSPRYEPPHLRHRPGDTFEIGGKPHDPYDPGPFGTSGWYQDQRTGRHRRGELPDPLPEAELPDPLPEAEPPDRPRYPRHQDRPSHQSHPNRSPRLPQWPRPVSSPPTTEPDDHPSPIPSPTPPVDETRPSPYRRYRRWEDPEPEPRNDDPPYRFSPLREGAMQRFLELSQPFRDAHFQPQPPTFAERLVWVLRWFLCVAACGLTPAPRSLTVEHGHEPAAQTPCTAVRERRFAAPSPAHRSTSFSVAEGGAL